MNICKLCTLLANGFCIEGVTDLFARSAAAQLYLDELLVVDVAVVAPKRPVFGGARIDEAHEVVTTAAQLDTDDVE